MGVCRRGRWRCRGVWPGVGCDVVRSLEGLEEEHEVEGVGERDWNANIRTEHENRSYYRLTGPKGGCEVPTLEEMGIDPKMATRSASRW